MTNIIGLMIVGFTFGLYLAAAVASVLAVYYLISLAVRCFDKRRDDEFYGRD